MGQYFIAINRDKREWLHPHRFGDGMKFFELTMSGGGLLAGLAYLLREPEGELAVGAVVGSWVGDYVSLIGDYHSSHKYHDAMDSYRDVSFPVIKEMASSPLIRKHLTERVQWRIDPAVSAIQCDPEELALYRDALGVDI
tara:strand:+ start:172 stop:591 length:420 start_codon:yes stop_codon:yes gene_type:complete